MPHSNTAKSPTGPAPMIATSVRLTSPAIASPMSPPRPALPWSAPPGSATAMCVICSGHRVLVGLPSGDRRGGVDVAGGGDRLGLVGKDHRPDARGERQAAR